jgi:hypothetical protein
MRRWLDHNLYTNTNVDFGHRHFEDQLNVISDKCNLDFNNNYEDITDWHDRHIHLHVHYYNRTLLWRAGPRVMQYHFHGRRD